MSKRLIIVATLALNSLAISNVLAADDTAITPTPTNQTTTPNLSEMSKDAWLKAMEPMLPKLICKGFINDPDLKKRFDELKITYDQCVTMIPDSEKKCQEQIYTNIPATINSEAAGKWGKALGECIGKDFAEKHLIPKS